MTNEMGLISFPGRIGLQQRVLPTYRAPFFDALAMACQGGLSVFAGLPRPEETIATTTHLGSARYVMAHNWHFLDASSPLYLCWQWGLTGWLNEWQPDVLIVEANPRYPSTRLAVRWMKRRHCPVIGWGLGIPGIANASSKGMAHRVRSWEWRSFLHSLDGQIAYSRRGAEEYRSLDYPPERLMVAPNAVSPRSVACPPERSPAFIGSPCVLFIGRLQERKRVDNLIRACAALPPGLQPRLFIVGEGPAGDGLKALAQQVYPKAEFVGSRHGAQLEPYFAQADLFVLPGTGGLAVQEAMAHGLPVIVAQGDGTQVDLVRPESGWIIPSNDEPALKDALASALSIPTRLRQMGAESYRMVVDEVNVDVMVAVFIHMALRVTSHQDKQDLLQRNTLSE